ncbi:hypothetical protein FQR65_LT05315 [Abscondita terminalis]|nr:hypothetical protein FQR65_LT05315 [Abscondita terminalis]
MIKNVLPCVRCVLIEYYNLASYSILTYLKLANVLMDMANKHHLNEEIIKLSTIILVIPPPEEMHLLLGIVSTLYTNLLKLTPEICSRWTLEVSCERPFINCFSLYVTIGDDRASTTRPPTANFFFFKDDLPINLLGYVTCLEPIEEVTNSAFRSNLHSDYSEKLNNLKDSFLKLGIKIMHAL